MNRDDRLAFLNRLASEEIAPDAIIDGRDILQRSGDEPGFRVLRAGAYIYSLPERHADPMHEEAIRKGMRSALGDPSSLKDGDACVVYFRDGEKPPPGLMTGSSYAATVMRRATGDAWNVRIQGIRYDVPERVVTPR